MLSAGGMRSHRVRIERRDTVDDGRGNTQGSWAAPVTVCTIWASARLQLGRERVEAGRNESTTRGTVFVPRQAETLSVTSQDRLYFVAGPYAGQYANIISVTPTPDYREVALDVEVGVAT
jgi:head-tail adaptor